jgi:hypothetical protein
MLAPMAFFRSGRATMGVRPNRVTTDGRHSQTISASLRRGRFRNATRIALNIMQNSATPKINRWRQG